MMSLAVSIPRLAAAIERLAHHFLRIASKPDLSKALGIIELELEQ